MPRRPIQHVIDERAETVFRDQLPASWPRSRFTPDYAKDFCVEIFEDEEATGELFIVQLKGKKRLKPRRDGKYTCRLETDHLKYFHFQLGLPVFLVLVDTSTRDAFYAFVQGELSWVAARKPSTRSGKIEVDPANKLSFFQVKSVLEYGPRERMMSTPTPPLAAETNALREAYAAFNRNDLPGFVQIFDPQIEWIEPAEFPGGGGTYRGLDAVRAHLAKSRQSWAEGRCEPRRTIVAGDRIIQFVNVRVRLKHETAWREGQVFEVYTFRDGKVIEVRLFADSRQALEWAGVRAPDAT